MRYFVLLLGLTISLPLLAGENLVLNSDLEKGTQGQPADWSRLDGLTVTWEKSGGNPGGYVQFNPSVTQAAKRANDRGESVKGATEAKQGEAGQYGTVGAHEGVWAFPKPIEVKADDRYFLLEADVKGPRSSRIMHPQVFVRGFQIVKEKDAGEHSSYFYKPHADGPGFSEQFGPQESMRPTVAGDRLMVYRAGLVCRLEKADTWQHFTLGIKLPKNARYRPEVILLKPYAMWPLGLYGFDNVSLRRCTKAEYDAAKKIGHSAKGF